MSNALAMDEMLKLVEQQQVNRCREALTQAQEQAQLLVRAAQRSARARVHAHVQALKHERRQAVALAAAELDTTHRQFRNRCDYALIEAGMQQLEALLLARWQDAHTRRRWIEALVQHAMTRLPRCTWHIDHPSDWAATERDALDAQLTAALASRPAFRPDRGIRAGLRIQAASAVLDATLEGVLADRAAIEAQLLAQLAMTQTVAS